MICVLCSMSAYIARHCWHCRLHYRDFPTGLLICKFLISIVVVRLLLGNLYHFGTCITLGEACPDLLFAAYTHEGMCGTRLAMMVTTIHQESFLFCLFVFCLFVFCFVLTMPKPIVYRARLAESPFWTKMLLLPWDQEVLILQEGVERIL